MGGGITRRCPGPGDDPRRLCILGRGACARVRGLDLMISLLRDSTSFLFSFN